ncbi:MAG: hypothetical protein AAGC64_04545 [Bacteroidota bacterium]
MKAFIFSFNFLLTLFLTLPLALCSSDDDNPPEPDETFRPIEVTFTEDFFTDCNQVQTIDGARVSYRLTSENENPFNGETTTGLCDFTQVNNSLFKENREGHVFQGEYRIFIGNHLEIDLSQVDGASKVIISIDDDCSIGCTRANLYENGQVISTISNTTTEVEELEFNVDDNSEKVTVYSAEGFVYKITLE